MIPDGCRERCGCRVPRGCAWRYVIGKPRIELVDGTRPAPRPPGGATPCQVRANDRDVSTTNRTGSSRERSPRRPSGFSRGVARLERWARCVPPRIPRRAGRWSSRPPWSKASTPEAFAERCGNLDTGEIHIAAGESTLYLCRASSSGSRPSIRASRSGCTTSRAGKGWSGCAGTASTSPSGRCSMRRATSSIARSSRIRPS